MIQNILLFFKVFIFSPFYVFKQLNRNMFNLNCGPSAFKYLNHNFAYTKNKEIQYGNQSHEILHSPKDGTLFSTSKSRKLQDYIQINKSLKITFNDLIIAIVNSATNKFYKSKKYFKESIGIICPISLRGFPEKFEDTILENDVFGMSVKLPLINDVYSEIKTINKKLADTFRDFAEIKSGEYGAKLMNYLFPDFIFKPFFRQPVRNADFVISNVAGPKESVFFNDIELVNYYPFLTTGMQASFITVISYNNYFSFSFNVNEGIELNPWEVMGYFESEFDFVLEQFIKIKNLKN